MQTTPAIDSRPVHPADHNGLARLVDVYTTALTERRAQLSEDLAVYRRKLRELAELDPLELTGLPELYREHVRQIERLLTATEA